MTVYTTALRTRAVSIHSRTHWGILCLSSTAVVILPTCGSRENYSFPSDQSHLVLSCRVRSPKHEANQWLVAINAKRLQMPQANADCSTQCPSVCPSFMLSHGLGLFCMSRVSCGQAPASSGTLSRLAVVSSPLATSSSLSDASSSSSPTSRASACFWL